MGVKGSCQLGYTRYSATKGSCQLGYTRYSATKTAMALSAHYRLNVSGRGVARRKEGRRQQGVGRCCREFAHNASLMSL